MNQPAGCFLSSHGLSQWLPSRPRQSNATESRVTPVRIPDAGTCSAHFPAFSDPLSGSGIFNRICWRNDWQLARTRRKQEDAGYWSGSKTLVRCIFLAGPQPAVGCSGTERRFIVCSWTALATNNTDWLKAWILSTYPKAVPRNAVSPSSICHPGVLRGSI